MKALIYTQTRALGVLKVQDMITPHPKKKQVQIAVRACALNIGDYQRFITKSGKISMVAKFTNKLMCYVGKPIGVEVSGVVTAVGNEVTHVKVGDAVKTSSGGLAEYAIMDHNQVCQKPTNLTFEEACCISVSFETALGAIRKANIKQDQ